MTNDFHATRRSFLSLAGCGGVLAAGLSALPTADANVVAKARELRLAIRRGEWRGPSGGKVPECVVCNLVVLPKSFAYDFLLYCVRNPKPCPVVEVTEPGNPEPVRSAPGADLRTDLARYAIYRHGVREADCTDIRDLWRADSIAFLIGSSLTFDHALERAGVTPSREVWVLQSKIPTVPAGIFHGPMAVTNALDEARSAVIASQLTGRFCIDPSRAGSSGRSRANRGQPAKPDFRRTGSGDPARGHAGLLGMRSDAPTGRHRGKSPIDDRARRDTVSSPTSRPTGSASLEELVQVALGGGLIQHVPDLVNPADERHCLSAGQDSIHAVTWRSSLPMAAVREGQATACNRSHHQAADSSALGQGLAVAATSAYGIMRMSGIRTRHLNFPTCYSLPSGAGVVPRRGSAAQVSLGRSPQTKFHPAWSCWA